MDQAPSHHRILPLATTLLLGLAVAPLGVPTVAAQSPEGWAIPDAAGDVYVIDKTAPATVPAGVPLTEHADLTGVRLAVEDEATLEFVFQFVHLERRTGLSTPTSGEYVLKLAFEISGHPVQYEVRLDLFNLLDPTTARYGTDLHGGTLCIREAGGECFEERIGAWIDTPQNAIHARVTKDDLTGGRTGMGGDRGFGQTLPPGTPTVLKPGDQLSKFRVTYGSSGKAGLILGPLGVDGLSFYDEAPNQGEATPYVLSHPMANTQIALAPAGHLQYDQTGHPRVNVEAGGATALQAYLTNKGSVKRIVNLTYALEGPAEARSKYHVKLPPQVQVPGSESRPIEFEVRVEAGASATDRVDLVLRGKSVGIAQELAHARTLLVPAVTIGPQNPVLHLHVGLHDGATPLDPVQCGLFFFDFCHTAWMNALTDDPAEVNEPIGSGTGNGEDGELVQQFSPIPMDPGPTRDIALGEGQPITFNLKLKPTVGGKDVTLRVRLASINGTEVARAESTVELDLAGKVHTLTAPANPFARLIPADSGPLVLHLRLSTPASNALGAPALLKPVQLLAKESSLILPLVEPPKPDVLSSLGSPVRLGVEDPDGFVNPGEARLFNVTLINLGTESEVAHLAWMLNAAGWTAEVLPGADYSLDPGESVVFGVLVRAPGTAVEGDQLAVVVNATTDRLPGEFSSLRLNLVAITQQDFPDDTGLFRPHEDAQAHLIDAGGGKRTPGPETAWLLGVAAVLIAAVYARRR